MKRRPRSQRLVAEINITPFTDVILVLLIIFMVTTPLIFQFGMKIQLPQAESREEPPRDVTVVIDASGQALLNKKQYSLRFDLKLLKFNLSSMIKENRDATIIIQGDKNVQYDFVMKVIDLASQVGFKHIVLATELKK